MAETKIIFQLYPVMDLDATASQAASQFIPLIDIAEFELQERKAKNLPIAAYGNIEITILNRAVKPGSETDVWLTLKDCDGEYLENKEISFEGTTGGNFTQAKVTTDEFGQVKTKFKLTSHKQAILRAQCVTKNVKGCETKFRGSEVLSIVPLVKVTVEFEEYSEKMIDRKKANPFGAIEATGGKETEVVTMLHALEFFHSPSPEALKKGFLVWDEKTEIENYGSTSNYIYDLGFATYSKTVQAAEVGAKVPGIEIKEKKEGYEENASGSAPARSAEIQFFTGDGRDLPQFSIMIEYPLTDEHIAENGIGVVKGENSADYFESKKITDPNSPYKMEYKIKAYVDLGLEFKKVFDFGDIATQKGYRYVNVTILSPYPEK